MSTLDVANNSNGEIPVHLFEYTKKYPQNHNENHFEWIQRLQVEFYRALTKRVRDNWTPTTPEEKACIIYLDDLKGT